tara:strand:+ start:712 stop:1083 length:372 start_codon:yes stop_codon:yes gene_type:complete
MDNKKSLMTAGIVGVGGVALAYLGHSYLTKKEEPETDMDKAADTVEKSSFFDFIFSSSDKKNDDIVTPKEHAKENLKIGVSGVATDPVVEGEAIKAAVGKTIGTFGGFFRSSEPTKEEPSHES